jgi:CBS domain-containing protein
MQDLLDLLSSQLGTEAIMTPWHDVEYISAEGNSAQARAAAQELMFSKQYSAVPVMWEDRVVGVYFAHDPGRTPRYENLRDDHFVPNAQPLFQLIERMAASDRVAVGVGTPERPVGWVTYADFSKRPFRVLLFTLLAEIEFLMAHALDVAHPDGSWVDYLPVAAEGERDHQAELLRRQQEALHWDVTMPLTTFAEIGHLIHGLAGSTTARRLLGLTPEDVSRLRDIPELRNRVSHVVKPIVAGPKQIKITASRIQCLLNWAESWSRSGDLAQRNECTNG